MCPLTSIVAFAAIGGYVYVGVLFGRVSTKAGNPIYRVLFDAITWPIMAWAAIGKLYAVTPSY